MLGLVQKDSIFLPDYFCHLLFRAGVAITSRCTEHKFTSNRGNTRKERLGRIILFNSFVSKTGKFFN